ncbi:MAG: hypothetical protein HEQ13_06835 [Dolichospermum sp. DEX189]|nr:hypothetical protein [Dolichospermum sp. DEX189]
MKNSAILCEMLTLEGFTHNKLRSTAVSQKRWRRTPTEGDRPITIGDRSSLV